MGEGRRFHIVSEGRPDGERDQRDGKSRKIVLLDLENMLFGDHESESTTKDRSQEILRLAEARRPTDMVIVGCNPHLAFSAKDLFPLARIVTGKGHDGADRALIDTIDLKHAAERFHDCLLYTSPSPRD